MTWKRKVTPRRRLIFQLEPLGLHTSESGFGFSLGVPKKSEQSSKAGAIYPGQITLPTPRKNRRGFADSHGKAFPIEAFAETIGGRTGSTPLAAIYESMMGYPPGYLAKPLKLMEMQSSRKSRKPSDKPSSTLKGTRLSASKRIVAQREIGAAIMSKLRDFARGIDVAFTEAEEVSLVEAGLAFIHDQPSRRLMLTNAGWALLEGPSEEEARKGRGA
jgi:hypothetical protein